MILYSNSMRRESFISKVVSEPSRVKQKFRPRSVSFHIYIIMQLQGVGRIRWKYSRTHHLDTNRSNSLNDKGIYSFSFYLLYFYVSFTKHFVKWWPHKIFFFFNMLVGTEQVNLNDLPFFLSYLFNYSYFVTCRNEKS